MGEPSAVSRETPSNVDHEELAEAVAAARGAHEMVEELHAALLEERARNQEVLQLREKVAHLEIELEAVRATRMFRYTARLRAMYGARRPSG